MTIPNFNDDSSRNSKKMKKTHISESMTKYDENYLETESNFSFNIENICKIKNSRKNMKDLKEFKNNFSPTDATLGQKPFVIEKFVLCTFYIIFYLL